MAQSHYGMPLASEQRRLVPIQDKGFGRPVAPSKDLGLHMPLLTSRPGYTKAEQCWVTNMIPGEPSGHAITLLISLGSKHQSTFTIECTTCQTNLCQQQKITTCKL